MSFVVIGGGTGTFSVLSGLKKYTDKITAVVSMADSGGSARKERDEWGLLPSSDVRKSLIALADISNQDNLLLRKLFQYRYDQGKGVRGMTFGNLFLVALTKLLGSQTQAIEKAGDILNIRGRVLPVSYDTVDLVAAYEDGTTVIGEHFIDEPANDGHLKIIRLSTKPKATLNPEVKKAIDSADVIIIGPGGFYTTILANFVIPGVSAAVEHARAKKIFILNLMTEFGQTYNFTASVFVSELSKYMNTNQLNYVFLNNEPIPSEIIKRYERYHARPVVNDLVGKLPFRVVAANLLSPKLVTPDRGDEMKRSLIRHSPEKLARLCLRSLGLV